MTAHRGRFVGYFRVSTDKQGRSGEGFGRKANRCFSGRLSWKASSANPKSNSYTEGKRSKRTRLSLPGWSSHCEDSAS